MKLDLTTKRFSLWDVLLIAAALIAPDYFLANNIGADEAAKTSVGVAEALVAYLIFHSRDRGSEQKDK